MQIQRTLHGFDCRAATTWLRPWSCAKIECLASDEKKGWVYLGVTTPKDSIEIYKSASTMLTPPAPVAAPTSPAFVYTGERGRDLEDLLDGYDHGTAFYTSPQPW